MTTLLILAFCLIYISPVLFCAGAEEFARRSVPPTTVDEAEVPSITAGTSVVGGA